MSVSPKPIKVNIVNTYKTNNVKISDIVAIQANQAKERFASFGDPIAKFPQLFAEEGWNILEGLPIAYELTPAEQDAGINQRKANLAEWRKNDSKIILFYGKDGEPNTATYKELADYSESLWTDDKGVFIKPKYGANCCYRRMHAIAASAMAYTQYAKDRKPFDIPSQVKTYDSNPAIRAKEMRNDRLQENAQAGRKPYTMSEHLAISCLEVATGVNQVTLRNKLAIGVGVSQKLHSTSLLCNKFESLNLLARFNMLPPTDEKGKKIPPVYAKGGYIPLGSVTNQFSRTLLGLVTKADKLDLVAVKAMGHDKPEIPATEKQVEAAIKLLMTEKTNAPKMMSKDSLSTIKIGVPDQYTDIHKLLGGILQDDGDAVGAAIDEIRTSKRKTVKA